MARIQQQGSDRATVSHNDDVSVRASLEYSTQRREKTLGHLSDALAGIGPPARVAPERIDLTLDGPGSPRRIGVQSFERPKPLFAHARVELDRQSEAGADHLRSVSRASKIARDHDNRLVGKPREQSGGGIRIRDPAGRERSSIERLALHPASEVPLALAMAHQMKRAGSQPSPTSR
jgi:hypothetical protein